MANDLVVRLGASLDQYQADMARAGDIADSTVSKVESSFSKLNPSINLSALVGGGALAALSGLFAGLRSINSELADLAKNAEYAGVSVERFQELRFAATQGGVGSKAASDDLRNVAKLLTDAKENENSLTKLLDANNIKYRDRNGEVIKLNQLLTVAGDLLKRFNSVPEKVEAARMLGLSEEWVRALSKGGAAFNDVAASAEAAGAVIDKSTVAKAAAFDEAWKKSSELLSNQFKAVTADVAGWLDDLIDKAGELVAELAKDQGGDGKGQARFNATADALAVASKESLGLAQNVDQLTRVIDNMSAKGGDPDIIRGLEAARVKAQELAKELATGQLAAAMTQFPGGNIPLPGARPAGADKPTGDAKLPKRKAEAEETASAYERQYAAIEKSIAVTEAETKAVGTSVANKEALKEKALLYNAAARDGITVTEAYAKEIEALAGKAGATKQALADAQAQMAKINAASQQLGSALASSFADAIVEGKALNDVLSSLLKSLAKMAINSAFSSIFSPGTGGTPSPFSSLFGIGKNAEGTNNWRGGLTWVGEKGPEILNLPKGSQVIPNAKALGMSGGQSFAPVYNIDARGADVAAVARLEQVLARHQREFAANVVATVRKAKTARAL